jgi:hypothetical protein
MGGARAMLLALAVAGGAAPPAVQVATERPEDRAVVEITTGGVVVRVASPRGIGRATLTRGGGRWPARLRLRLELKGLEALRLAAGGTTLVLSGTSGGRPVGRVAQFGPDGRERDVPRSSPLWTDVRALRADGRPATTIPLPDGAFELDVPAGLLADNPPTLALEWVDFHR